MELSDRVWNASAEADLYGGDAEAYQTAVLEQYKLYVEMADRISQRRGLTNTFFLTLNTTVFTLVGVFWEDRPVGAAWWLVLPLIVVLGQCYAWSALVRSYRTLNTVKFTVIQVLEERLPASPYARGEWSMLSEGNLHGRYRPLTHIETWIPALFAAVYLAGFVAAVAA